jgi:homoserine kinase
MSPIERPCLPSPEALQVATDVIRRRYVLPETMERPEVRSECMRLAYLIMAYGLGSEYDRNRHGSAPMNS